MLRPLLAHFHRSSGVKATNATHQRRRQLPRRRWKRRLNPGFSCPGYPARLKPANELPGGGSCEDKTRGGLTGQSGKRAQSSHLSSTLLTGRPPPPAPQLGPLNWTCTEQHGWSRLRSELVSTEPPSFPGSPFRLLLSEGCSPQRRRRSLANHAPMQTTPLLQTTPGCALYRYWFISTGVCERHQGRGKAAIKSVLCKYSKIKSIKKPDDVMSLGLCPLLVDRSISSEGCADAGSSVRSDRSPPCWVLVQSFQLFACYVTGRPECAAVGGS